MKTFLSLLVAISLLLLMALLGKELFLDAEGDRFGAVTLAVIVVLTLIATAGFVSLWLHRSHAKLVEGVWLSMFSVVVAYVVVDFIAGQFLLERLSPPIMRDEAVHHKLVPDTESEFKSRDFNYVQRVNSIGLRGNEINTDKAEGSYRVMMLGDSFTMGKGVRDDETFSALLEASLLNAGRKVEVLNAGVDSYSPILSYRQLVTRLGTLLEPDLVVINLDMSDLMQEVAYRSESIRDDNGEIIGFRAGGQGETAAKIQSFITGNLYFTGLLYAYLKRGADRDDGDVTVENTVAMANPELLKHTLADDDTDRSGQWQNIFESILKIRDYCAARGIDFLLTTYPWGHQVSDTEWVPGRYQFLEGEVSISDRSIEGLEAFARSNAIDFVNLFPAFRSYQGSSPLYYDYDMHWTVAGHRIVADGLERIIIEYIDSHD